MFLGREKEIQILNDFAANKNAKAGIIYGKRRVGKSTLIQEFSKVFNGITIAYECGKISLERNMELFADTVSSSIGTSFGKSDFKAIFSILGMIDRKFLIIIDEYQFLKKRSDDYEMDSILKQVIDNLSANIKIIINGSSISVMKDILKYENPLYGRFDMIMNLKEFDYYDSAKFYPELNVRDKISYYAVFGGSPYVLSCLNPSISLKENIKKLLLSDTGTLRTYIEYVITSEIDGMPYLQSILESIRNSKLRYSEIENKTNISSTGILSRYLEILVRMDFVDALSPINKKNDKKKKFYSIKDNLLRFYYTYIYTRRGELNLIGEENFYNKYIANSLDTFISYRFERIAWQYFSRKAKFKGYEILDIGSYWFDDKKNKTNREFDCVVQLSDGEYSCYEVKFYQHPMPEEEARKEIAKINDIGELSIKHTGLICSAGFSGSHIDDSDYVTGDDLYH